MKKLYYIIALLSYTQCLLAQVSGRVTDSNGEALSYVNIYIEGTTIGTTSNIEGYYKLDVDNGSATIMYQYIGFETEAKQINNQGEPIELDVQLQDQAYSLDQIVIAADAEDPAYAIIRKARDNRAAYRKMFDNYSCDVYMKGFNKITDAPEKILGRDVGDIDGLIDSTRQGIVYLSESVSKLFVKGNKEKEVMYSSKISGDPQGYSFNSASEIDFSFYDNTVDLNRAIVSPIASNCMSHYDYQLEGTYYENDQLINNIKVIPKNTYGNVVYGNIFIVEDQWNIKSLKLNATKEATQVPFVDLLTIQQEYHQITDERWVPLSTVLSFDLGAFGFELIGNFAAVYSNFDFAGIDDATFTNEVFNVLEGSNDRTDTYWDTLRPIPLTKEESVDYHDKDSIRIVKESPAYLDSIDREANKIKLSHLFSDYSYQNSQTSTSFRFDNPVFNTRLNTIQGWNSSTGVEWRKRYSKQTTHFLKLNADVSYGFSEKKWRPTFSAEFRDRRFHDERIQFEIGNTLTQFNRLQPISETLNSIYTLIFRENFLKAYDNAYVSLSYARNLHPSVFFRGSVDYESRDPLLNSYKLDNESFTSNDPLFPDNDLPSFQSHDALLVRLFLRLRFGREVWRYPDQVFLSSSKWPTIDLFYKGGFDDVRYHLFSATIQDRIPIGIIGQTRVYAHAATFLGDRPEFVMDFIHVNGNQTFIANSFNINQYYLLPYYTHSADKHSIQFHLQHQWQGFLMSKIPLLKRTQFQFVSGYKFLATNDRSNYHEFHAGIENIGIGIARIFRLDAVWSFGQENDEFENLSSFGVILSLGIDF